MNGAYLAALLVGIACVSATALGFLLVVVTATAIERRRAARRGGVTGAPASQLAQRAAGLLIGLDEALETSAQNAGFAEAEFGEEVARPYRDAVQRARATVADAFRLQQHLDGGTSAERRELLAALTDVVGDCERAKAELETHAARLEILRALARHAPEVATAVEDLVATCGLRVRRAEKVLARLHESCAASVLAPIEHAPEQARERLRDASASVSAAREAIAAGDEGGAAERLGRAEEEAAQAARLLEAVDDAAEKLAASRARLTIGLTETRPAGGRFQHS